MIHTLDGKKVKRGQLCFVIGVTVGGVYTPCRCKAHSKSSNWSVPDESKVYSTYEACQAACNKKNAISNPLDSSHYVLDDVYEWFDETQPAENGWVRVEKGLPKFPDGRDFQKRFWLLIIMGLL